MTLKEKLLNIGLCIDNEYLDRYVKLIEDNKNTKREKCRTQKHHIVPKYYFKRNNLKLDNSKENTVNLVYKEHIIAHILLSLCSSSSLYAHYNFVSIQYISDKYKISDLDMCQKEYELSKKLASEYNVMFNKETKEKHLCKMRSREVRNKISETMKSHMKSGKLFTEEQRKHISQSQKNQVYIYNDEKITRVYKTDLDEYLKKGWKLYQRRTYGQLCGKEKMTTLKNNFKMFSVTNKKCYCIIEGNKYTFNSIRDATIWWYENYHPFGEHYSECTLQRKIKLSAEGKSITYLPRCNCSKKHTKDDNKLIEINYIKWFIE